MERWKVVITHSMEGLGANRFRKTGVSCVLESSSGEHRCVIEIGAVKKMNIGDGVGARAQGAPRFFDRTAIPPPYMGEDFLC